jgi:hypothetical protein
LQKLLHDHIHLYQKIFCSNSYAKPHIKPCTGYLIPVDILITGLRKLIAKTKYQTGAMQQLLQPKEGWEVEVREVCLILKA